MYSDRETNRVRDFSEISVLWIPELKRSGFYKISVCIDVCNAGMKTDRSILTEFAANMSSMPILIHKKEF